MTCSEALEYLETFINYEKLNDYPYKGSFKLERMSDFLKLIGQPQLSLKCLHVAGSKGKGSTSAFIAYILRNAGYRTGLYTSPHLSDFRERIRILHPHQQEKPGAAEDFEGMIPGEELARITGCLRPALEEYNKSSKLGELSFFEAYTAVAFLYFKEAEADYVVLETGLGGRLDATNTARALVSAITPISLEHTQKLGNTISEIAAEKAGIIKSCTPVISALQKEEAANVIRERCLKFGAKLYEEGKDITYKQEGGLFSLRGINGSYQGLKINLTGDHQLENATVAVGTVEALSSYGVKIGPDEIKRGLAEARWPGRCEVVSQEPLVVLDGAQNAASSRALKEAVRRYFKYDKLIMILGVSADKDIKGMCSELSELADTVILTKADNPRAASTEELSGYFPGKPVYFSANVKEAREKAYALYKKGWLILVCGSLFVVGEFRDEIKANN